VITENHEDLIQDSLVSLLIMKTRVPG